MHTRILVWDLPTRIFHWSLALSFAVAFLTAESERWQEVHILAGYLLLGLLSFRLIWGFVGSRYARFAEFVRGPNGILAYLRSIRAGRPQHHVGHNPAGALAIIALIALGLASGVTGWLLYDEVGGEWLEELHEGLSNAMLAVVVLHVAGVLIASRLHRENLIRAMITGRKHGLQRDAIPNARVPVAVLLVAMLAVAVVWGSLGVQATAGDEAASDGPNWPSTEAEPDDD